MRSLIGLTASWRSWTIPAKRAILTGDMIENTELIVSPPASFDPTELRSPFSVPRIVSDASPAAPFVWDEFFRGTLRNPHTRTAYSRAVQKLLLWLEKFGISLAQVTPGMIGGYFDELDGSVPTKKLALAAIRRFFDAMVQRHVMILNPAASVRGERYTVVEGKTPEIAPDQARALLSAINTSTPVGLRDRAVIATLIYTAARAGAVASLRLKDFAHDGTQYALRFAEKGGKSREIPVRHDLERYLQGYLAVAVADDEPKTLPLFRTLVRRTGKFTANPMSGTDIWRMVKRRLKSARLPAQICPHSFRVATVTNLLSQGVPLTDVQFLAGHSDCRTTKLYDRRSQAVSRNLVERISI
jgi:site-specific recombinase XerD